MRRVVELDCSLAKISSAIELRIAPVQCLLLKLEPLVTERRTRIFLFPLLDWYENLYPAPADEARGELDCSLT